MLKNCEPYPVLMKLIITSSSSSESLGSIDRSFKLASSSSITSKGSYQYSQGLAERFKKRGNAVLAVYSKLGRGLSKEGGAYFEICF